MAGPLVGVLRTTGVPLTIGTTAGPRRDAVPTVSTAVGPVGLEHDLRAFTTANLGLLHDPTKLSSMAGTPSWIQLQ